VQSERRLREEAVNAFKSFGGGDPEDEGEDVLEIKASGVAVENGEDEYRRFMVEMGGGEEEVRKVLGANTSSSPEPAAKVEVPIDVKVKVKKERKEKADDDFLMK
jgi:protein KRI1